MVAFVDIDEGICQAILSWHSGRNAGVLYDRNKLPVTVVILVCRRSTSTAVAESIIRRSQYARELAH